MTDARTSAAAPAALDPGEFRDLMRAEAVPGLWRPLAIFALDLALYASAIAGVLFAPDFFSRLACAFGAGFFTVLLFIVGHDACHGSFTRSRWLNQLVGRIAFLPPLYSFSLWNHGHNHLHHRFTNLKGRDYVWTPLTKAEFDALPWPRRLLVRLYRSAFGHGTYYSFEIWWKRMLAPVRRELADARGWRSWLDSALVIGFLAAAVSGLVWFAARHGRNPFELIALAVVVPLSVWNWFMGFATYQHHTHPAVAWFAREEEWRFWESQIDETVHVRFPRVINAMMHHILEHTAHHACTGIPLYRLGAAQDALEARLVGRIPVVTWTLRGYLDTLRRCKLYDYERHQWLGFDGRPTTPATVRDEA